MSLEPAQSSPAWQDLPDLPLYTVASRLDSLPDLSSFRGVCASWRAASDASLPVFLSSHPPLLSSVAYDRLFCPHRGIFMSRPGGPPDRRRWAVGCSAGFLILAESSSLARLHLADPVTGREVHALPEVPHAFSRAVVVRGNGYCVTVVFNSTVMQYCRVGDREWGVLELPEDGDVVGPIRNLGVLGEKVFGLTVDGDLVEVEFAGMAAPAVRLLEAPRLYLGRFQGSWLGASGDDLIAVTCTYKFDPPRAIDAFLVRRYNFQEQTWEKVSRLGGRALFVDMSWGVLSETAGKWGGKEDCIYFTDPMKNTVGVFDLKDGSIKELVQEKEEVRWDLAVWVLPSLCI